MKAIYIREFGGPENLELRDLPDPARPTGSQVLVRVRASALNRADLLQRLGKYPPPPGCSPNIPGLEFAGEIDETGDGASRFKKGDRVFAITAGEAQAEYVLVDERVLAPVPENLSFIQAAAVPEAFITAHDAIFSLANLRAGESILIHAVGSGVGLAGLQLARAKGAAVIGTSRTAEKLDRCRLEFGLDHAIATPEPVFAETVLELTGGRGVDVVFDLVGGAYFKEDLASLATRGRLVMISTASGAKAEIDLGVTLFKRLTIIGTVLRSRPLDEKIEVNRRFIDDVLPLLASGAVRPVVDRIYPAAEIRAAHEYMQSNKSFGKIVIEF
ncbi:MAG: NAD(P)H-quinone oxidoreductase [Pyrinomonadaceae bacterium]